MQQSVTGRCCNWDVSSSRALLVLQLPHQDKVFPAVRVKLGVTPDALVTEPACEVAVDRASVVSSNLELDAVHAEIRERPVDDQTGGLASESLAA